MNCALENTVNSQQFHHGTISRWPDRQADVTVSRTIATRSEEDSLLRWPWIPYIQENGNLFFVEPYSRPTEDLDVQAPVEETPQNDFAFDKEDGRKRSKALGKIKQALRRKRTFAKGDKDMDTIQEKFIEEKERNGGLHGIRKLSYQENNNIGLLQNDCTHEQNGLYDNRERNNIHSIRKTVVVRINQKSVKRSVNLLESKLGLLADYGAMRHNLINGSDNLDLESVLIQEVLPNGPCAGSQEIKAGCKLVAVNGTEVSSKNLDYVLAGLYESCEVVLVIEQSVVVPFKPKVRSKLLDLISGIPEAQEDNAAIGDICCVAYLTLDSNEDDKDGDILFWYPDSEKCSKLKAIRGMFLTLADLMDSVTGTPIKSSSLTIDERIIHICYAKERNNVLVVAAPDNRCSLYLLEKNVQELERLLCLLYGSLERTFKSVELQDVEHLVMLFMERLLCGLPTKHKNELSTWISNTFCGVKQLCLSSQHKVWISNTLSDAEAADYGECADDFFPHRRLYSTLGTCLFYKGHLVCNHLGEEDTVDFMVYCKLHGLLLLNEEQKVNQMVIWREIFPARKRRTLANTRGSFEEPAGRWYFLAVSQKQSLLCMLLEAGGVASMPQGNPGPHPYYVDTAASILAYMQEHFDFETICEARLRATPIPALSSVEDILNLKAGRQSPLNSPVDVAPRKLPAHLQHIVSRTPMSPFEQLKLVGNFSPDDGSLSSCVTSPTTSRRQGSLASEDSSSGSGSLRRTTISGSAASVRKSMAGGMSGEFSTVITTKLTAGAQNVLFYYTNFDTSRGVLICPNYGAVADSLEREVLHNFQTGCETIRERFSQSRRKQQTLPQKNGAVSSLRGAFDGDHILEQGILFKHRAQKSQDSKKQSTLLRYWVVGRCLRNSQQLFVCFRDGIPQNVIELAFKLGFGTL